MRLFRDLTEAYSTEPTVLTIGTFDGLHRGHQDVIRQVQKTARRQGAKTAVIAFHPRPKEVFTPHLHTHDYLTTPVERIAQFESLGLDLLVLIPFTHELAQITAHDFIKLICKQLNMVQLCVGHDFALGKNREGDIAKLKLLGQTFNFNLSEIEPFTLDGQVVSSTQIRKQLLDGDVRNVTYYLGRYPSITSHVVQGLQRGRLLGFPTANFDVPPARLLPANGVYATFVAHGQERLPSVTNIGIRPSFDGHNRTVETFIFDFNQDIYNKTFTLEFVERLRPEKKFDGIDALVAQITQDAALARTLLEAETVSAPPTF